MVRDVVRGDRDDADAALAVVLLDCDQPSLPRLDVGAVVARLDEHERTSVAVVLERMVAAVDAGQGERRRSLRDGDAHVSASSSCSRLGIGETRPSARW